MTQVIFEELPPSDLLAQLIQTRKYLPFGNLAQRLEVDLSISSLAYRERQRTLMDEAIEDGKETAFRLISVRPLQPTNALSAWGIAAVSRSDALAWRLARLPIISFSSDRSKQPPVNLKNALRIERYASMLIELHFMIAAIAERRDGSAHERNLLEALRSDKHDRRTYVWIETLYRLIVAIRDNQGIDAAVTERGSRLHRLLSRANRDERDALDFAGLGILGVGKRLGRTWNATSTTLPLDLLVRRIDDIIAATQKRRPMTGPAVTLRRAL